MLGNFPTWFQIRGRGKQYAIAVRVQILEPELLGGRYDLQEKLHLTNIHATLMDRCNIDHTTTRPIDPEYDWYLNNGIRYYYYTYPIPFPWRHPFLHWLNELVGPDGSMPTAPHNIPDQNTLDANAHWWNRTYMAPRARANPRTTAGYRPYTTIGTTTTANLDADLVTFWNQTTGGNNGGGTL